MLRTRLRLAATVTTAVITAVLGLAGPASAAAPSDKPQVMNSWTQSTAASYNAWNAARQNQGAWAAYGFDWSTDYCSTSPDQPLGFDFRLPCQHHDWGYRNFKAIGQFDANKSRIDDTFYFDLQNVCRRYSSWQQPACNSLAWTYYEAVSIFGLVDVADADLQRAERTLKADRARHAAAVR
jgi:phospholipase A2-like protein